MDSRYMSHELASGFQTGFTESSTAGFTQGFSEGFTEGFFAVKDEARVGGLKAWIEHIDSISDLSDLPTDACDRR